MIAPVLTDIHNLLKARDVLSATEVKNLLESEGWDITQDQVNSALHSLKLDNKAVRYQSGLWRAA